jgi:hypothetical protein
MVNAQKQNIAPLPPGKYGKSTIMSTHRSHQATAGKSGLEVDMVRALGALCGLGSKQSLAADKRHETHISSHQEIEKWIKHFVERETAVAQE